jgi:hypothetical protein
MPNQAIAEICRSSGKTMSVKHKQHHLRARIKEFLLPPIEDGLVLGIRSPIGHVAVGKALTLLSSTHYQHVPIEDDVISDVLIRSAILRKMPMELVVNFILREIKPLMGPEEILHLDLEIALTIEAGDE